MQRESSKTQRHLKLLYSNKTNKFGASPIYLTSRLTWKQKRNCFGHDCQRNAQRLQSHKSFIWGKIKPGFIIAKENAFRWKQQINKWRHDASCVFAADKSCSESGHSPLHNPPSLSLCDFRDYFLFLSFSLSSPFCAIFWTILTNPVYLFIVYLLSITEILLPPHFDSSCNFSLSLACIWLSDSIKNSCSENAKMQHSNFS